MLTQDKNVYSEVCAILEILGKTYIEKIPKQLYDFFCDMKNNDYACNFKATIPIEKQNISDETITIISYLYIQYWCENETEKQELIRLYRDNDSKYEQLQQEKYEIFKRKESSQKEELEETHLIPVSKNYNFIKRFFEKVKQKFFKWRR